MKADKAALFLLGAVWATVGFLVISGLLLIARMLLIRI
jgi:hypothetical protein